MGKENEEEEVDDYEIAEIGSSCYMKVGFIKNKYMELYEDCKELG